MTRTTNVIHEIRYEVPRVEILDAVRDALQEQVSGAGDLGGLGGSVKQWCEFVNAAGDVLDVAAVVIRTHYVEAPKGDATP